MIRYVFIEIPIEPPFWIIQDLLLVRKGIQLKVKAAPGFLWTQPHRAHLSFSIGFDKNVACFLLSSTHHSYLLAAIEAAAASFAFCGERQTYLLDFSTSTSYIHSVSYMSSICWDLYARPLVNYSGSRNIFHLNVCHPSFSFSNSCRVNWYFTNEWYTLSLSRHFPMQIWTIDSASILHNMDLTEK